MILILLVIGEQELNYLIRIRRLRFNLPFPASFALLKHSSGVLPNLRLHLRLSTINFASVSA